MKGNIIRNTVIIGFAGILVLATPAFGCAFCRKGGTKTSSVSAGGGGLTVSGKVATKSSMDENFFNSKEKKNSAPDLAVRGPRIRIIPGSEIFGN